MVKSNIENRDKAIKEKRQWVRLTKACNNNCLFCHDSNNLDGEIIAYPEIVKALKKGRAAKAMRAILSGGEPTLHPELFKIARTAKKMGYRHVQLVTNGRMFAYDKFAKEARNSGLDEITFSLHSHKKDIFEKITGIKGSYNQALSGLENARKNGFIISIDVVINRLNYQELKDVIFFYKGLGAREFDLLLLIPFGRAWKNKNMLFFPPGKIKKYLHSALAFADKHDLCVWANRIPAQYLEGYEFLVQAPQKLEEEVLGRKNRFSDFIKKGIVMDCHGLRCQYCVLSGFCRDLILSKKDNILKSFAKPFCLKGGAEPARAISFSKNLDLKKFFSFYISQRYYAKSLRCARCLKNPDCSGALVSEIRKKGFKILRPINK